MSDFKRDDFFDDYDLAEAIRRINDATGGTPACPYCSGRDWLGEMRSERVNEIAHQMRASPAFVSKDPRSKWGPAPSIPAVVLTCMDCGNIRLHNYAWMMRPGTNSEEGPPDE